MQRQVIKRGKGSVCVYLLAKRRPEEDIKELNEKNKITKDMVI